MEPRTSRFPGLVLLLSLLASSPSGAHEFWLEASCLQPDSPCRLGIKIRVGEDFAGEVVAGDPSHVQRFWITGPDGERPVAVLPGFDPGGFLRIDSPGIYTVGYRSTETAIEIAAAKFESYLAEDGLEHVSVLRAQRGHSERSAREVYSRCAKTIVASGCADTTGWDRVLGMPLELVCEVNPLVLGEGDRLTVRLLHEGSPLEGALVVARHRGHPVRTRTMRSDRNGRARFDLPRTGEWLISAVHMVEATDIETADWRSLWASLTFAVPAPTPARGRVDVSRATETVQVPSANLPRIVTFWRPRKGVVPDAPEDSTLGESMRAQVHDDVPSPHLEAMPSGEFFDALQQRFPGATLTGADRLEWQGPGDESRWFVARRGPQFVEVTVFGLETEELRRIVALGDHFGCQRTETGG